MIYKNLLNILKRGYKMKLRNITMTIITLIIMSIILIFINQQKNNSFEKLESEEVENEDYTINSKDTGSDTLLIAIHGGGLEPGTTELVEYIAKENNYSYYTLNRLKSQEIEKCILLQRIMMKH